MITELIAAQHNDLFTRLQKIKDAGADAIIDPLLTSFGVRVKVTEHGWVVLVRTYVNWRILDCRNDPFKGVPTEFSGWTRGWCYAEPHSALTSTLAAVAWSGAPDTEPSGWVKSIPDQRRHGEPRPDIRQE